MKSVVFSRVFIVLALSASSAFASAASSGSNLCPVVDIVNAQLQANPDKGRFNFTDASNNVWTVYQRATYKLSSLLGEPGIMNSRGRPGNPLAKTQTISCHYTCLECEGKSAIKIISIRDR